MVMKRNAMCTNLRQSIVKSFGRYIAIAAIIALGSGLFLGLLMTKTDMVATGQYFTDQQNMFDIRAMSNYGWSPEYVEKFAALDGVEQAEGVIWLDLIARTGSQEDEAVYRFYSLPQSISTVSLRSGRMPENSGECLADGSQGETSLLGQTVTISANNDEDSLDSLTVRTFTIVGCVASPLYMDMSRGTTTVGSGSLENYYYVPEDAFDVDYYTEIDLTIPGSYSIYSEEYNQALEDAVDALEPEAERLAQERFTSLKAEAEEEYDDGYQEYLDGKQEYEDAKAEAEQELGDAEQELKDAEQEVEDGYQKLIDAGNQIEQGRKQIDIALGEVCAAREAANQQIAAAAPEIAAARQQLDQQYAALAPNYESAVAAKPGVESQIQTLRDQIAAIDPEDPEQSAALADLQRQLDAANTELAKLQEAINGMQAIQAGYQALDAREQQMNDALAQIDATEAELLRQKQELHTADSALMVQWGLWGEARDEVAQGWVDYEEEKAKAEQELADAEAELKDAEQDLKEAREDIDAMEEWGLYLLDRNTNLGYTNLDSSSDIVAGISRIFPVFFLLVASLVCITTMTRMIDEERTQIGTLKALGYSNGAIISKYLLYSGTSAVLGCALGILAGSTIFPQIIWNAYCIMLYVQPEVVLTVDWPLCIAVVAVYLAVMLFVTWYSCHRALEEEPAELIRPKSPDPGKKILLEYAPFWSKISFLNKVTIRNIFRYRQRLAMMLIGIGGCTALLLAGFGLRDSIVNVADIQFDEVTLYDMSVYFREENTPKELAEFCDLMQNGEEYLLYHQSSVEVDFGDRVKEIYLISSDDQLQNFIDFHRGKEALSMPGEDEVLLSVGVTENLGIHVGDTVTLRDADMQTMELTVSGIYDNHVQNYAIVLPETIEKHWGTQPELQMAFVKTASEEDVHALSAAISGLDNVMNVSISQDMADMVKNMMDALDLVVVTIVFCAGLLAVVVLYNLTNININERIREIATIKVLGFYPGETSAYVFKENMTLTVVGALIGLLMGKLLLWFIMSQVKIDFVWFKALANPISYVWSFALTILSAIVVDFIFYFRLEKINMAEALKSVE